MTRPAGLALSLSAVGLGSAAETRAYDGGALLGTAQVRQQLALLELARTFRPAARLQPFLAAGLGLHHAGVEGMGVSPLFHGDSGGKLALAMVAGAGLAVRLTSRTALLAEAQLLAVSPTTAVRIVDQEPARIGRPGALLSLGVLVSP